jgi:hypothetical protein
LPIWKFVGSALRLRARAQRAVIGNARQQSVTAEATVQLRALCAQDADFEVTLISRTIAVQNYLSEILLRSIRRRAFPERSSSASAAALTAVELPESGIVASVWCSAEFGVSCSRAYRRPQRQLAGRSINSGPRF